MSDLSEKLAAIEALEQAATPGPWKAIRNDREVNMWVLSEDQMLECNLGYLGNHPESNAAFIAASREAVPFLLALVRDQAAKLAAVEEVAERYKGIALSGTPGTMETRTAAALAAGHIRIALEVKA